MVDISEEFNEAAMGGLRLTGASCEHGMPLSGQPNPMNTGGAAAQMWLSALCRALPERERVAIAAQAAGDAFWRRLENCYEEAARAGAFPFARRPKHERKTKAERERSLDEAVRLASQAVVARHARDTMTMAESRESRSSAAQECLAAYRGGTRYAVKVVLDLETDERSRSRIAQLMDSSGCDAKDVSSMSRYLGALAALLEANASVKLVRRDPLYRLALDMVGMFLVEVMTARGHEAAYHDGVLIVPCGSSRAAGRIQRGVEAFCAKALGMRVVDSGRGRMSDMDVFGYAITSERAGGNSLCLSGDSMKSLRAELRRSTNRSWSVSNYTRARAVRELLLGFVSEFELADIAAVARDIDEWLERRYRALLWKRWKRVKTRFSELLRAGVSRHDSWRLANCRKGYWHVAADRAFCRAWNRRALRRSGFVFLSNLVTDGE